MAVILIVEDETAINELIQRNLKLVGHTCISAYDGAEALSILGSQSVDLIILDIMLPKEDGFSVFQKIEGIPTIFLTAKSGMLDKVKGLSMGADDYITKPFEMLELLARVEAVLRRTMKQQKSFKIEHVNIELESHQVFLDNEAVEMTPKEYSLLETLVLNRNIALPRERLLELVWGYEFEGDTRTVDVHIQKLRKKLKLTDNIKTVYKLGYRLETNS